MAGAAACALDQFVGGVDVRSIRPRPRWSGWLDHSDRAGLQFGRDVIVPDVAGWRRERMPKLPETAWFEPAPDRGCEVLSPSTARIDRQLKMRIYAAHGVPNLWLVDPLAQTLESYRLENGRWLLLATHGGDETVAIERFEAVPTALAELWAK